MNDVWQDPRSSDCVADRLTECSEESGTPAGSGSEGKGRPVTLCVTQSAHETQAVGDHQLTDQDAVTQRRSASESDV